LAVLALGFQLSIVNFGSSGNLFCDPLPASFSQTPHPGVDVLLQTKGEVTFDSLMTALSRVFPAPFSGLIWLITEYWALIAVFQ
jgi:hypothetical protein